MATPDSHAGGMNSYAVTAAQQAGDYYNSKLMDVLPEQTDEPAAPEVSGDRYAGTDYYQDAIDAALRGDRVAAEAALAKRAEKMASPDYHGTGGGTSMEEAYSYIESLLAGTERTM